jgi:hypothetical protein
VLQKIGNMMDINPVDITVEKLVVVPQADDKVANVSNDE